MIPKMIFSDMTLINMKKVISYTVLSPIRSYMEVGFIESAIPPPFLRPRFTVKKKQVSRLSHELTESVSCVLKLLPSNTEYVNMTKNAKMNVSTS